MFCAISGNVPEQPVVSTKTGHLFEKRLVEKYVRETGKCPVTGETLAVEELLPLKTNKTVKPRPSPATSIPGLLGLFHDEWDALMVEHHTIRQNLHTVRQELSHSLYQHDAACRVIARLMKERDEARASLETVRQQVQAELASKRTAEPVETDEAPTKRPKNSGISEDIIQELNEINISLSKARKKRTVSPTVASVEEISALTLLGSHPVHKTTQGGIYDIGINPEQLSILATGGADGTVQLYDTAQLRILGGLEGHSKRITAVQYLSSAVILTSSADKTARVWKGQEGQYECAAVLKDHTAEVVGITAHPSRKYFVTGSQDCTWCFYDLETTTCLRQVADEQIREPYTCIQFHPDGLIMGTGTEKKVVRIWEVKQQKNVAEFAGHEGAIKALAFSENGFHLATAATDGVKLWDLRKLKNFKTLTPYEDAPCTSVAFDYSGLYLAVGGADARIYGQKQDWSILKTFPDMPKKGVYSIKFGTDAKTMFVGAADHNLRVFGIASSSQGTEAAEADMAE